MHQKTFTFEASGFNGEIGFAVVETTDDDAILSRVDELLPELVACKKEKGLSCIFLAVVNIVKLHSKLLLCGPTERALAQATFGDGTMITDSLMDLGGRVSRKKDYIPVMTKTINGGWERPQHLGRGPSTIALASLGTLGVDPNDPHGNVIRRGSTLDQKLEQMNNKAAEEKKMMEIEDDDEDLLTI